jgi:hypothetical protein
MIDEEYSTRILNDMISQFCTSVNALVTMTGATNYTKI